MHEYNNNEEATNNFFVKDKDGNVYGDCKLWATIKGGNRVILHGRIGNDFRLSDGSVVVCCLDKEGSCVLGNIYEEEIDDIINKNKYINFAFSNNKRVLEICKHCNFRKV